MQVFSVLETVLLLADTPENALGCAYATMRHTRVCACVPLLGSPMEKYECEYVSACGNI